MQTSSRQRKSPPPPPPRKPKTRFHKGRPLGPRPPKLLPADAVFATSAQVCRRYGGKSRMWLWRKLRDDPAFPRPTHDGPHMMFAVAELNDYDRALISKKTGGGVTSEGMQS
jgi:hypothetical protein